MRSHALFFLFVCIGCISGEYRDKRTIGILFRSLVDAVTGPDNLAYPPDPYRKTTPAPSRPQTQIFFVPISEKHVEMKPAPLKPADLAEIHVHPTLVKQLESLVHARSISGKMVASKLSLDDIAKGIRDNIKAPDTHKESRDTSKPEIHKDVKEPPKIIPPKKDSPSKYLIKILPEHFSEKGAVSVTIAVGKDGKIRIVPGKETIEHKSPKINEIKSEKDDKQLTEVKQNDHPKNEGFPTHVPPPEEFIYPPIGPIHPDYLGPVGVPIYQGPSPVHDSFKQPAQIQHHDQQQTHHESQSNVPNNVKPYPNVEPYSDFLNILGLLDGPPSQRLQPQPPFNSTQNKPVSHPDAPPLQSNNAEPPNHFPLFKPTSPYVSFPPLHPNPGFGDPIGFPPTHYANQPAPYFPVESNDFISNNFPFTHSPFDYQSPYLNRAKKYAKRCIGFGFNCF